MGEKTCRSLNVCSKNCFLTSPGQCIPSFLFKHRVHVFIFRWVNRKDQGGNNVFEGGFLGLDNIGAFNRSEPLPTGGSLRQADGTAWMAFYCLNMQVIYFSYQSFLCIDRQNRLSIALELAKHNPVYEDIASKFFEVRDTCA